MSKTPERSRKASGLADGTRGGGGRGTKPRTEGRDTAPLRAGDSPVPNVTPKGFCSGSGTGTATPAGPFGAAGAAQGSQACSTSAHRAPQPCALPPRGFHPHLQHGCLCPGRGSTPSQPPLTSPEPFGAPQATGTNPKPPHPRAAVRGRSPTGSPGAHLTAIGKPSAIFLCLLLSQAGREATPAWFVHPGRVSSARHALEGSKTTQPR